MWLTPDRFVLAEPIARTNQAFRLPIALYYGAIAPTPASFRNPSNTVKGLIHLTYRKIIDANSQKLWDKYVFDDTYMEFFMQAQTFNPGNQYATFQELVTHVPQAERLHALTSAAAIGYIRQLNNLIPDIANVSGKLCLPFSQFTFEIIQSHVENKQAHRIAILFYSDPLTWIDTVGNHLLIAYGDQRSAICEGQVVETDLIAFQPYLNIATWQAQTIAPTN